jgi:hypothetical protein
MERCYYQCSDKPLYGKPFEEWLAIKMNNEKIEHLPSALPMQTF